jgi:hypothetical protein
MFDVGPVRFEKTMNIDIVLPWLTRDSDQSGGLE